MPKGKGYPIPKQVAKFDGEGATPTAGIRYRSFGEGGFQASGSDILARWHLGGPKAAKVATQGAKAAAAKSEGLPPP